MTNFDRIVSIASWLIIPALLFSIVGLWISPPTGAGPVAQAIGILGSQVFYTIVYGTEGAVLTWAKLTGRMKWRKAALLAIFLTGLFTFGLTITIIGFSVSMLDNMALFVFAGVCYVYWKVKTEYVSPEKYKAMQERDSQQV